MKRVFGSHLAWMMLAVLLAGCNLQEKEGVNETNSKFLRRRGEAVVVGRFGLLFFPVIQNYVEQGGKKLPIRTGSGWFLSSGSKVGLPENQAITNLFWRESRKIGRPFRKIFPSDVLVSAYHSYENDGVYGFKEREKIAFYLLEVVERDTSRDGVLDSEEDRKSLYLFYFRDKRLVKITPDSLHVREILHRGFVSPSDGWAGLKRFFLRDDDKLPVEDYLILFEAKEGKKKQLYLYHVKGERLENLSQQMPL